jgi:hypothetical protein
MSIIAQNISSCKQMLINYTHSVDNIVYLKQKICNDIIVKMKESTMKKTILSLNCGSSSLKFNIFNINEDMTVTPILNVLQKKSAI